MIFLTDLALWLYPISTLSSEQTTGSIIALRMLLESLRKSENEH
jgi:hypothetical protein